MQANRYIPIQPTIATDLIGSSRLVLAGVDGMTDVVEGMHRNIAGLAPIVGQSRPGPTRGITGLVYRNIRRVSGLVGIGLDLTLNHLEPRFAGRQLGPGQDAARSAINGVLGDYLVASGNPLAIPMQLRHGGAALTLDRESLKAAFANPGRRLVVLVHGLCMNDRQWRRHQHDHGEALGRDLGYTPLYLHYNSGRPITENGREFAALLELLVREWPVSVDELVIVGHSMGGLVSRSACRWAQGTGYQWPGRLKAIVFLGTPHHGAALERLGNGLDFLLGISPYSAPIGRIGRVRSAGIQDLREGNVGGPSTSNLGKPESPPPGARFYAVAASTQTPGKRTPFSMLGDGLVSPRSALGQHPDQGRSLAIPSSRQALFHGLNHFDLLDNQSVYERLLHWLGQT